MSDRDILGDDWVGTGAADTVEPEVDPGDTLEDVSREIEERAERAILQEQMDLKAGVGADNGLGERLFDQRRRPDVGDWHYAVRNWMDSRADEGWNKPFNHQIYSSTGLVCAGRGKKQMGPVAIIFDVSYSVPEDKVSEMLAELQEFLDRVKPKAIHIAAVSDRLKQSWEILPGDVTPETLSYGGRTALQPGFDFVDRVAPDCEGMIYMTDGESYDLDRLVEPEFPMLWLDWSGDSKKYPFGEVVVMESK